MTTSPLDADELLRMVAHAKKSHEIKRPVEGTLADFMHATLCRHAQDVLEVAEALVESRAALTAAEAKVQRAESARRSIQSIYDLQAPTGPEENYLKGARVAHLWWERVLRRPLDDLRAALAGEGDQ